MKTTTHKIQATVLTLLVCLTSTLGHAAKSGQQAPNFTVQNLANNSQFSLDQFKGKLVYLDFWASWCPPCLKSFPFMEELKTRYSDQGLVVVAISLDENPEDARAFLKKASASFFVGHNKQGDIATMYNVQAMPSSYLIDRDGNIQQVHRGFKTSDKEKLKNLIASKL